jgi:hypothetical protein
MENLDDDTAVAPVPLLVKVDYGDKKALVQIYFASKGDAWSRNTNWSTLPSPQAAQEEPLPYYGVTLNSNGRVVQLDLRNNNLSGK